ncbi:UTP-glucose-1-phosphate uridylyltransferase [Batrachochytrium salamandrivorans]|nr:UTP-glucose-1-phosphate uridylyltransferase [Batrachochytrium salamandrivorans]
MPLPSNESLDLASPFTMNEAASASIDHIRSFSLLGFQETTSNSAAISMRNELNKMVGMVSNPVRQKLFKAEMDCFYSLFTRYLTEKARNVKLNWDEVKSPGSDKIIPYKNLETTTPDATKSALSKLAVLKLNGGLGTTMGCVGPKSAIEVRDGMTFLDLTVRQIEYLNHENDVSVPLILMNSFNTDEETKRIIQKYWYPPGHGDLFESLSNSGTLDKLIAEGKEYLFISNVDNLGATVDKTILSHLVESGAEFLMEVTDKTKADIKGGTLIEYEGSIRLLEIAQVTAEHIDDFKSVKKFKIFNTNNLWVSLHAIKRVIENQELSMEIIVNNKLQTLVKKSFSSRLLLELPLSTLKAHMASMCLVHGSCQ